MIKTKICKFCRASFVPKTKEELCSDCLKVGIGINKRAEKFKEKEK